MDKIPRRDFLKLTGAAFASLTMAGSSPAQSPIKPRQPNILVFLTDDQGQWAQRVNGNSELLTPNMDRIAAAGTRMTQAFTPTPVCSPARASFFTGRVPSQHGIHDWLPEIHTGDQHPNLAGQVLISDLLKQAGYYTGLVGKWHCGNEFEPQSGFDYWFSFWKGQKPHEGRQSFSDQGKLVTADGQQSPFLTDRAIDFLRTHRTTDGAKEKPFFLFIGYTDTHSPHDAAPDDLVKQYDAATFRDIPKESFAPCHGKAINPVTSDAAKETQRHREYYGAVSSVDREVGRVLAELEASGELANTLIVYTGDHGLNTGHHGIWEKGNATVPQNFLEESTRVGCAISWPAGGFRQNATCDDLVNHCDLWATLLDVAGATPSAQVAGQINSPGVSYLPQLRGTAATSWRQVLIGEYGNARMARTMRYKLIKRYPYEGRTYPDELYDLQEDPRETVNRFQDPKLADVVQQLSGEIEQFFARYTIPGHSGLDLEQQPSPYSSAPWKRELKQTDAT
jgi:arylsulfatase A-like enzyme